jgi:dihydrodipicolinate synthase/N-acetylneuraminate lyase
MELIRGIIVAPTLPMTEEFEVDWAGLPDYLRWLAPPGPDHDRHEHARHRGPALSLEERLRVIEASRAAGGRCGASALVGLRRGRMRLWS